MFDEPIEEPEERTSDPAHRAKEKADEIRMHAELYAVFEGRRKFEARLVPGLDMQIARDVQRAMAKLERSKTADSPVLPAESVEQAAEVLGLAAARGLSTNDYHIHRRPGEVMIVRWLEGEQVESFYTRMQAHFDAGFEGVKEDEQSQAWRQEASANEYLNALEAVEVKTADRYLRDFIRAGGAMVLSTVTADEMDILHLADHMMNSPAEEVVGSASAPPEDGPTDHDRAWFFKLFSLRGMVGTTERMCFFAYLQKSDDDGF